MLIADHMPFPKAAEALASQFGFTFVNGYAMDVNNQHSLFKRENATLMEHAITQGMKENEAIHQVRSFMGQAFQYPKEAKPLMVWGESALVKMPKKSWAFNWDTPAVDAAKYAQGATLEYHKGRIAVFGEAAMFTSQTDGKTNTASGLVSKGAEQNEQFLLNIMHWLSRTI